MEFCLDVPVLSKEVPTNPHGFTNSDMKWALLGQHNSQLLKNSMAKTGFLGHLRSSKKNSLGSDGREDGKKLERTQREGNRNEDLLHEKRI